MFPLGVYSPRALIYRAIKLFNLKIAVWHDERSLFCFWAVRKLGICLADLARRLGMSLQEVGYAVQRGRAIAHENIHQSAR